MKLSTIAILLTVSVSSASALAKNTVFKPLGDNIETQACITAATEGLDAAKALVVENELNFWKFNASVSCNGESLSSFAKKYNQPASQSDVEETEIVRVVAVNEAAASRICADALIIGEKAARSKHGIVQEEIYCNGREISSFVRQFKNRSVEVVNSAE